MSPLMLLASVALATVVESPTVVVHSGRDTAVFDANRVEVVVEGENRRIVTPMGVFALPTPPTDSLLATPGQSWLLDARTWVDVRYADHELVEFVVDPERPAP